MPFALTSIQLEAAMKLPGCPVCRLAEEAVRKSADGFLYENTMNPDWRKPIMEAHGFCPTHTQLLVAVEMSSSGPVLGINYIYEQLARQVADELHVNRRGLPSLPRLREFLKHDHEAVAPCPLCAFQVQTAANLLSGLFEELEPGQSTFRDAYTHSSGLCYAHLSGGISEHSSAFPAASKFLIELTSERLKAQSTEMREYIRKHDWHYKDEVISNNELTAWKRTLTFFTGLPEDQFNHKIEKR